MAKLFDAYGNEVEAFTKDELEVEKQKGIDEYVTKNPDKAKELDDAKKALDEANKKLKDAEEGGKQLTDEEKKKIEEGKNDATVKLAEIVKTLTDEVKSIKDGTIGGTKTEVIRALSKGDTELQKKLEMHYDNFKGEALTKDQIVERAQQAFTLATGNKPAPNFMDGVSGAGGRGDADLGTKSPTAETENAKSMRNVFGITDAQAEKFGPEAKK